MKKIFIILIAIALIAVSFFVYEKNESDENADMEQFAKVIADESDKDFETAASIFVEKLKNDQTFNGWFENNIPSDDSIFRYLKIQYFDKIELLRDYAITFALCDNDTYIKIDGDNEVLCNDWFVNLIDNNDKTVINDNLFQVDDPTTDTYYLISVDFPGNHSIFLEFYKNKNLNQYATNNLKNYSFSIYKNNILDYKFGNYLYPNSLKNFISQDDGIHKGNRYKHLIFNVLNHNKTIIVTIEYERWLRFVAPFSIIFFALLLSYFLYIYFYSSHTQFRKSFHGKMQITILLTLAFSFFIVGFVSFLFLNNNIKKKTEILQYKQANIIRNKLETNILDENSLTNNDFLHNLAETFICDIKIYDLDGNVINSTLSDHAHVDDYQSINENAYHVICEEGAGYFMQTEWYGDEKCSAYYFPILDKNNELIAVLNVPYFDSDSEYDDRISSFILNYINIIIVLLCITSIIIILITRKTLKPLKIIEEQMGKTNFGVNNEPIEWNSRDEIGALIQQYNKMLVQLENAANQLARNERENAWREMARQVAHEIKNPLTPMRLNIEYLQMLWERKDPNFEENFKETLTSLLEQIETLSKIATAFSNYAKLPENTPTTFDLSELLKSTIKLYDVEKNISITLIYNEKEEWPLFADRNNLGRVFGNIIKNAIQAIGSEPGHIELILSRLGERYKIKISDNGCGIKEEDKAKIFFPNFTTKSSGMGVGLSVSQNIVQAMGGNITFSSKVGIGTVFTIDIPILKEM
ncbi:MAG: GHKL domain-containing protein [Bacteroidales bacterium]|nr:GHKL domain-containing protein [Bacteroidales bacterium]